jgi:hypothetical protein
LVQVDLQAAPAPADLQDRAAPLVQVDLQSSPVLADLQDHLLVTL